MPSLKAWEQGSRAPAHRQVVQGPAGASRSERRETDVTDLVLEEVELLQLREGPALNCLSESGKACIANVVAVQK